MRSGLGLAWLNVDHRHDKVSSSRPDTRNQRLNPIESKASSLSAGLKAAAANWSKPIMLLRFSCYMDSLLAISRRFLSSAVAALQNQ